MKNLRSRIWKVLSILIIIGSVAGVTFLYSSDGPKSNILKKLASTISAKSVSDEQQLEYLESEYLDYLIADSIISILLNFYIDADRSTLGSIYLAISETMNEIPGVHVEQNKNKHIYTIGNQRFEIPLVGSVRFEAVINQIVLLGRLLESEGLSILNENGKEMENGVVFLLRRVLEHLDAHSKILTREEYNDLRNSTEGSFGGLGVLVGMENEVLTVIEPLPNSPAEKVGISNNDRILTINGKDTYGYTLPDLVEYMRGAPGTVVDIKLLRHNALGYEFVKVKREIINVDSVTLNEYDSKNGKILHISIESFTAKTSTEIAAVVKNYLRGTERIAGMILDLRGNPGGLLDQAVKVADFFLTEGTVVSTRGRTIEIENAGYQVNQEIDWPLVVLIDRDSASASEIVAGALQDHNRALILGRTSFGKGSVQTIFELPGGRAVKLTIARYFTPNGRSIQSVGITPDIILQPVYSTNENKNLLGEFRYRSERFLSHSLGNTLYSKFYNVQLPTASHLGYFLVKKPNALKSIKEYELNFAKNLLIDLNEDNSIDLDLTNSQNMLIKSESFIEKELEKQNKKTKEFMSRKMRISWEEANRNINVNGISFDVFDKMYDLVVHCGETIEIPYSVLNNSYDQFDNLSVYLRWRDNSYYVEEQLVGKVPSHLEAKGSFKFHPTNCWDRKFLNVDLGVAVDGYSIPELVKNVRLQLKPHRLPIIETNATFIDSENGKKHGELEANENAVLTVKIENKSEVEAKNLVVKVLSLAGKQLNLLNEEQLIPQLGAFESKEIRFRLKGGTKLVNSKFSIGYLVENSDIMEPIKKKYDIRASIEGSEKSEK